MDRKQFKLLNTLNIVVISIQTFNPLILKLLISETNSSMLKYIAGLNMVGVEGITPQS